MYHCPPYISYAQLLSFIENFPFLFLRTGTIIVKPAIRMHSNHITLAQDCARFAIAEIAGLVLPPLQSLPKLASLTCNEPASGSEQRNRIMVFSLLCSE